MRRFLVRPCRQRQKAGSVCLAPQGGRRDGETWRLLCSVLGHSEKRAQIALSDSKQALGSVIVIGEKVGSARQCARTFREMESEPLRRPLVTCLTLLQSTTDLGEQAAGVIV